MKIDKLCDFFPKELVECWKTHHKSDALTNLQKQVFSKPDLFFSNNNLIIQAPTSSGKTFVAEAATAYTLFHNINSGVLYLAPFKALVFEKYKTFLKTFSSIGFNVFQSSSDYRMFDRNISNGSFDVVVTVYEKLLSLLVNDGNEKILTQCKLIIFDELQFIEDSQRGPKIEMLLAKIQSMPDEKRPRLLGLITSGYNCEKILPYFDGNIIYSDERPIPLIEKLVDAKRGSYWTFYDPLPNGIQNGKQSFWMAYSSPINDTEKDEEQQNNFITKEGLYWLLDNPEWDYNANSKVIIFCSSRRRAEKCAYDFSERQLNSGRHYFISQSIGQSDLQREPKYNLISKCLKAKTAFHHAGLSQRLREYIEREFLHDDGAIQYLFSTETLSIGVNFPADVVIIADNIKYEGQESKRSLSYSEYKNFLGRAGRLGLNSFGKSYFIFCNMNEAETFKGKIMNREKIVLDTGIDISSSHSPLPYILYLLQCGTHTILDETDLHEYLLETTLLGKKIGANLSDYITLARQHHLISREDLTLTALGEVTAKRLIDMETLQLFPRMKNAISKKKVNHFDLLYFACHAPNILAINAFHLSKSEKAENSWVFPFMERFIQASNLIATEWQDSWVFDKLTDEYEFDNNDKKAIKCAVVLYLWKEKCDVDFLWKFAHQDVGDIITCAEAAAYVIECFSDMCDSVWNSPNIDSLLPEIRQFSYEVHIGATGATAALATMQLPAVSLFSLNKISLIKNSMISTFSDSAIGMTAFCITSLHKNNNVFCLTNYEYRAIITELLHSYNRYAPSGTVNGAHLSLAQKYSALVEDDTILNIMLAIDADIPPYESVLYKLLTSPPFLFDLSNSGYILSIPGLPPLHIYHESLQDADVAIAEFNEIYVAQKRTNGIKRFITWDALLSAICLSLFASNPKKSLINSLAMTIDSYKGKVIAVQSFSFYNTGIVDRTAIVVPFEKEPMRIAENLYTAMPTYRHTFIAPISQDAYSFWTDLMINSVLSSSNIIVLLPTEYYRSWSAITVLLNSLKQPCALGKITVSLVSESPGQFVDEDFANIRLRFIRKTHCQRDFCFGGGQHASAVSVVLISMYGNLAELVRNFQNSIFSYPVTGFTTTDRA